MFCIVWCTVVLKLPYFQTCTNKTRLIGEYGQSAFELQPCEVIANHSTVVKLKLLQDWEIYIGVR